MPQTDEALKFAQRAQGSLLVAINKMDAKGADADKVKTQMQERSIASEDWGGEIVTVPISALKGDNADDLLDMILLQAELMELKANLDAVTEGVVVEARQEVGRGATAVVIVQKGTFESRRRHSLRVGLLQSQGDDRRPGESSQVGPPVNPGEYSWLVRSTGGGSHFQGR